MRPPGIMYIEYVYIKMMDTGGHAAHCSKRACASHTHTRTHARTHSLIRTHTDARPPGDPGDRRGLLHGAQAQARLPHRLNAGSFHAAPMQRSRSRDGGRCWPRNAIGRGRMLRSRAEESLRREYFYEYAVSTP